MLLLLEIVIIQILKKELQKKNLLLGSVPSVVHSMRYGIILIFPKHLRSIQQQSEPKNTLGFGVIKIILVDETGTFL